MNFNLWKNRILILSTLILNYTDLVTDILVAIDFAKAQEWFYFGACVFFVCIGPFILAVLVPVKERPCLTTVTQFLCLAPIFSAFDALKNGESNEVSWGHCFRTTKFVGSMLESLPEAGLQAFFLLESYMKSGATPGELQILSLTLAFISIVTATTTGRIGAVKFLPKEFNTDGIPIKILLMLASACELLSRIVSLCMALVAFPYAGAGLVGVEFLARLIFFAVIVEEEEIMHRVFSGFAASFFNLFMLAPGPWVGLPFESTGVKNTGALKGTSKMSRRAVWSCLLPFNLFLQAAYLAIAAGFFIPEDTYRKNSLFALGRNALVFKGRCSDEWTNWTSRNCFPKGLILGTGVFAVLGFLMLAYWVWRPQPALVRPQVTTIEDKRKPIHNQQRKGRHQGNKGRHHQATNLGKIDSGKSQASGTGFPKAESPNKDTSPEGSVKPISMELNEIKVEESKGDPGVDANVASPADFVSRDQPLPNYNKVSGSGLAVEDIDTCVEAESPDVSSSSECQVVPQSRS